MTGVGGESEDGYRGYYPHRLSTPRFVDVQRLSRGNGTRLVPRELLDGLQ